MTSMHKNSLSIDFVGQEKPGTGSCLLPDDVLAEILSYLPAKTFFGLLSVCKTFHQLSSDSRFLLSQSYRSKAISGFFVKCYTTFRSFLLVDPCADVPRTSRQFLSKNNAFILGSAGGLVFVLHENNGSSNATRHSLYVFNPARRTRYQLPTPSGECSRGGIAVSFTNDGGRVTKDYKLVYLSPTYEWSSLHHCRVYDSVANTWTMDKHLDFGGREIDMDHPVVCGETVFWASDLGSYMKIDPYVVAFDMRTECTQIIALPKRRTIDSSDVIGIAKWEGKSLCLIHYRRFSQVFALWLLEKRSNGVLVWVKKHEISLTPMGFEEPLNVSSVTLSEVATTTLLVFTVYDEVHSYSMKDGEIKKLASLGFYYPSLIPYSSTLRPCGQQDELLK
ncbi:unnamed protein product [Musa acuminata subsp. malaccensis]|uniref:(wild Malaysian banana) hypothetical protein n=1 Tax=Musa acuminata subsp. malaccensis TaxID=214687 RepID=A0A804JJ56_MUSAM|nr:PREDICTED: F-box protein At5g49610-like [Musa acuminata subsp. malaccensis]CAG1847037.1 unnamed protein product [Musa acuminata subsp. malaccensis]